MTQDTFEMGTWNSEGKLNGKRMAMDRLVTGPSATRPQRHRTSPTFFEIKSFRLGPRAAPGEKELGRPQAKKNWDVALGPFGLARSFIKCVYVRSG